MAATRTPLPLLGTTYDPPPHRPEPDPTELAELVSALRARAAAVAPDAAGRIVLARVVDTAVEALTAGLPDVDCAVSLAALPDLGLEHELPPAATADARGRLVSWLAGVEQQLVLGRAVSGSFGPQLARAAHHTP